LIKSQSKDIYIVKKFLFQINAVLLNQVYGKVLSSTTVFNIDSKNIFLSTKSAYNNLSIIIYNNFWNIMSQKTGVMMLKIQLCHHRSILH